MKTGADVRAYILQKVADDVEFRERLAGDPKGVIEAETGGELPDDALVFIKKAIAESLEGSSIDSPLTKDELVQVAGGASDDDELGEYCSIKDWHCGFEYD